MKKQIILSILFCILTGGVAVADMVISYDAGLSGDPITAPDPQTQGWIYTNTDPSNPDLSVTDVSPDATTGLNAWNITDNTTAGNTKAYYEANLNSVEQAEANENGWVMKAAVRHLDNFEIGNVATLLQYGDQHQHRFLLWFRIESNGNLSVILSGGGGGTYLITNDGTGADAYHDYEIQYDPDTAIATFLVDSVVYNTTWTGETSSNSPVSAVRFGSGSSGNKGSTNYNKVTFEVLPGKFDIVETAGSTDVFEQGETYDTYDFSLSQQPTDDVVVTVSCDPSQITLGPGQASSIQLTFTNADWSAQLIQVNAVDDAIGEGFHQSTINHQAASSDPFYDGKQKGVVVNITDNDLDFDIVQTEGTTEVVEATETSDTYTVELYTAPTSDVIVSIDPAAGLGDGGNVDLGNGPGQPIAIVFTTLDWTTAQEITVTAVDDTEYPVLGGVVVRHDFASDDPAFNGKTQSINVRVTENDYRPLDYTIEQIDITDRTDLQVTVDQESGQYLGQPDTVLLADGQTMFVGYPMGHGHPGTVLKKSTDGGLTWSDRLETPANFMDDHYAPVLHRLTDQYGVERLHIMVVTPYIKQSISEDNGQTWTPYQRVYDVSYSGLGWKGCAPPKSMIPIDGVPGKYLAMYHSCSGIKPVKIITEDGGLTWSLPETVAEHPSYPGAAPCEPGLIRSPDGSEIIALCRENSRQYNSLATISKDEGKTWSDLVELPASYTGDRHEPRYAPDGRIVFFIRNRRVDASGPYYGDYVGWVGTYDDIIYGREGQYRIRALDNLDGVDCGYNGLELLPDGTFVTVTYGQWDSGEIQYIKAVRFTLEEMDLILAGDPYCGQPGTVYLNGDLNRDCYVNMEDLMLLLSDWLQSSDPAQGWSW